jgi:hypothetical protein
MCCVQLSERSVKSRISKSKLHDANRSSTAAAQQMLLLPVTLTVPCAAAVCMQLYERIVKGSGFPYFVNGAGGQNLDQFAAMLEPGVL